ncbi:hypothetical protein UCDDA912_g08346 [Diaporthe ampelina]|uniref:Uncharacterized protein n=1 Tax=Diaporthe ampelina TaxID=1214573 RepID=A0A0G2H8V4_9PEZI|nr:hypothetical protein UCDDA912_g08346 [Diaporthe ampelina]
MHIIGKTSNDKYYDVVMCDSCVQYLQHIGCAFEIESEDLFVDSESAESAESVESAESADSSEFESDDFDEFESDDFDSESAEPAEPIDFVSVDVVFVEYTKLEFDVLESAGSGEPVSDEIESKELRKRRHYDVSQPKQAEIEVYGIHEATTRARGRFIVNAPQLYQQHWLLGCNQMGDLFTQLL